MVGVTCGKGVPRNGDEVHWGATFELEREIYAVWDRMEQKSTISLLWDLQDQYAKKNSTFQTKNSSQSHQVIPPTKTARNLPNLIKHSPDECWDLVKNNRYD